MQNCSEHVNKYLRNCEECNRAEPKLLRAPLCPLVATYPMEIIEVDFFGPLPPDPETSDR